MPKQNFVTVTGIPEIDAMFKGLPDKLRRKYLRGATTKVSGDLRKRARSNAPSGRATGTSALKTEQTEPLRKRIRTKPTKIKRSTGTITGGITLPPPANLLESGHVKVLWGNRTGEFVPPEPFVERSRQEALPGARALFIRRVREMITRDAKAGRLG